MSLVLAQQGAQILTFPSAFTQITGSAHWEVRKQFAIASVLLFFIYLVILLSKLVDPRTRNSTTLYMEIERLQLKISAWFSTNFQLF